MYVEVKSRSEDRALRGRMEAVRIGETDAILTNLDKHNSISAEVKHASRQLHAAASAQDFRLLWYRADNVLFVNDTKEQISSTLYGMRMVLAESQPFGPRPWHCAYAGHADASRRSTVSWSRWTDSSRCSSTRSLRDERPSHRAGSRDSSRTRSLTSIRLSFRASCSQPTGMPQGVTTMACSRIYAQSTLQ